ncbi:MAG: O-antigen ligase family protein, partial [Gammaproteobacteria bacterium]|nr:O-antigen ligase family protein [Gammaproteobacteria bacterium]
FRDEWSRKKWPSILARIGILSGFAGLVLSGSRSVWLALPVIALVYIASRTEKLRIRYLLQALGILALLMVALYQLPFVKHRWVEAANELRDYTASESVDDPARVSSLGARFEMWRAALQIIADNPMLGVGPGGYQTTVTAYYHQGGWSLDMTKRNGPHNQYLSAWASRGIAGLVTTVLIMAAPWFYCLSIRRNSEFEDIRQLALACMMFIMIFAITGLSDDSLDKKPLIVLYFTTLALLLGQIRHRSRY